MVLLIRTFFYIILSPYLIACYIIGDKEEVEREVGD